MKKQKKNTQNIAEALINALKQYPNKKKKGELSELINDDSFYNRDQTEDEYQNEQKKWLESVAIKKKKAD